MTTLTGTNEGEVILKWLSPGDDGTTGQLITGAKFHIATTTVLSEAQDINYWNSRGTTTLADIQISTSGVNPGKLQTYLLYGLKPAATYYLELLNPFVLSLSKGEHLMSTGDG